MGGCGYIGHNMNDWETQLFNKINENRRFSGYPELKREFFLLTMMNKENYIKINDLEKIKSEQ